MAQITALSRSPRARLLFVLSVTVLVAGLVLAGAQVARSATALPEVGAAELLASVQQAVQDPPPVAGDLDATLELGLPDLGTLEGMRPGADEEGLAALTGERRLRIARSGDGVRLAELGDSSERAFVTDGETAWTWDSSTLTATRHEVPAGERERLERAAPPEQAAADPLALAEQALAAVDDTTEVTVDGTGEVAGRATYRLILTPRTDETLVGRVQVDVDGEERLPLRVAVYARGAEAPSIEAGFTTVSFDPIDPATFTFTPPPGTTVEEGELPVRGLQAPHDRPGERAEGRHGPASPVRTFGEGWARVWAVPANLDAAASRDGEGREWRRDGRRDGRGGGLVGELRSLLPFSGPLFSARTAEVDGQQWVLVGAVPQSVLERAAQDL